MIIWVFVILILTSSYTATLTSMLTIQQIQLNTKGNYVGYGPAAEGAVINLNSEGAERFVSTEEYVDALSKRSKHGGSPLVHDMSWTIEKLREEGELAKLETEWFRSKSTCTFEESSNGTPDALSAHDFGGLFMISGISSTLALLLFSTPEMELWISKTTTAECRKYLFNKDMNSSKTDNLSQEGKFSVASVDDIAKERDTQKRNPKTSQLFTQEE
ncbi:hypothetical protein FNV43_RR21995 [Rhamnella rubrinervis]|uniref:Ionotropic glutamate receptor C-terminal domain-containing protein n=1 Tax=Rhamnella rubrinervis TaxID=2594499 RepID=A0A8K0GS39_9ROSA|nr:hypothetical protein FNV43_RR21995 [Rhamnella rubrinervis]